MICLDPVAHRLRLWLAVDDARSTWTSSMEPTRLHMLRNRISAAVTRSGLGVCGFEASLPSGKATNDHLDLVRRL